MDTTLTTETMSTTDEAQEAREYLAQRLERLARRVRQGTTMDVKALDKASSEVIKMACDIWEVLD